MENDVTVSSYHRHITVTSKSDGHDCIALANNFIFSTSPTSSRCRSIVLSIASLASLIFFHQAMSLAVMLPRFQLRYRRYIKKHTPSLVLLSRTGRRMSSGP